MNQIFAEELKDKIKHAGNITVVNVLAREYFDDCHIKGSINAPLNQLKVIAEEWDKSREIILYCASIECSASKKAYEILTSMDFEKVFAYEGGMKEWKSLNYSCAGECSKDYLKV